MATLFTSKNDPDTPLIRPAATLETDEESVDIAAKSLRRRSGFRKTLLAGKDSELKTVLG